MTGVEAWCWRMVDALAGKLRHAGPGRGKKGFSALFTGALLPPPPPFPRPGGLQSPSRHPPRYQTPPYLAPPPPYHQPSDKAYIDPRGFALAPSLPLQEDNDNPCGFFFAGCFPGNARPRSQNCPGHNQLSPTDHEGLCSNRRLSAEQLGPGSLAGVATRSRKGGI